MSPVVSDSSPLIAFALIDRFPVLRALFPAMWIPDAVYDEVVLASGRVANPGSGPVEEARKGLRVFYFSRTISRNTPRTAGNCPTLSNTLRDVV